MTLWGPSDAFVSCSTLAGVRRPRAPPLLPSPPVRCNVLRALKLGPARCILAQIAVMHKRRDCFGEATAAENGPVSSTVSQEQAWVSWAHLAGRPAVSQVMPG